MKHSLPAAKRMTKARSNLVLSQPFYGCLALHLTMVEDPTAETMWVDGTTLAFAPAFVDSLTEVQLIGVIAHEVTHCAYQHFARIGSRDPGLWNMAGDYSINRDLMAAGFVLPDCRLYDRQFDGKGTEEIYEILKARRESAKAKPSAGAGNAPGEPQAAAGGPAPSQDPGRCGGVREPAGGPAIVTETADRWEGITRGAVSMVSGRNAGHLPGDVQRVIDARNAAASNVDWREVTRRFIDSMSSRDSSWSRPNRRFIGQGLYLPSLVPNGMAHLVLAIDTSGSISNKALKAFEVEIGAALDEVAVERVSVIYADTKVHRVDTFEAGDPIKLDAVGGGGTAFRDTFERVEREIPDATAVIYFTDLDVTEFGADPGVPVLWAAYGYESAVRARMEKVPFGEPIFVGVA